LSSSSGPTQPPPEFPWDRPTDPQALTVVPGRLESPRNMLKPEHNFREIPPKLYWFDKNALLAWANIHPAPVQTKKNPDAVPPPSDIEENKRALTTQNATDPSSSLCFFFTQIQDENDDNNRESSSSSDLWNVSSWPVRPPLERLAEFPITPSIHAAYAGTWFSLSAAGIYMTRQLLRRGVGGR
jgi:hypothetical protein